jgi:hypothetical protein
LTKQITTGSKIIVDVENGYTVKYVFYEKSRFIDEYFSLSDNIQKSDPYKSLTYEFN